MKIRRYLSAFVVACAALLLALGTGRAQGNELQLFLSKTMGFALGSQIQGQFTLAVSGPADMTSVTYEIDGREMGTLTQAPYKYSFTTDDYAIGPHKFSATARTASGQVLKSDSISAEIVTLAGGWQASLRVIWPLFGAIALVALFAFGVQFLSLRGSRRYEPGAVRSYGVSGGAICPKCGRPFALPLFSPHLMMGKLVHCPYCGKWALVPPASIEALRAAERTELQGSAPQVREVTPEEILRRQIEESRLSR